MNASRLLEHFDRISEAPDAVPRLRRFILDLAVRGKLVEQDAGDEPAAMLVRRAQSEHDRRVGAGLIKKQYSLSEVRPNEAWCEVPAGWRWVRLGMIAQVLMGHSPPGQTYNKDGEGVPLINGPVEFTEGPFGLTVVNQYTTAPTTMCEQGDLLLCVRGSTTGRTNVAGFRACIGRGVAAIRSFVDDSYVRLFIWRSRESIIAIGRGIAFPSVSRQQLAEFPVPLPPLAEQHRLVAKVDELMALCDRLEAAQSERERRRDRLVATTLERLGQTGDATTFRNDARLYLANLSRVITKREHVGLLRDAILDLGVTGKLCAEGSVDARCSAEVNRTRTAHKAAGIIGDGHDESEQLPRLPSGWKWVSVNDVAAAEPNSITDGPFGANLKTEHYVQAPGFRVIRLQNIGRAIFREEHRSYIASERFERLEKHRVFSGDLVIAGLVDPLVRCCEVPDGIGPAVVKADCYRFKAGPKLFNRFALHYLNSPTAQRFALVHHHGMTLVRIGLGNFRRIPFPLPPLVEQHRIVARVDELMVLCDRLEGQFATAERGSRRLLDALLDDTLAVGASAHAN